MELATNYEKQRVLAYCDSVASGRPLSFRAWIALRLARAAALFPAIPKLLLDRRLRRIQAAVDARPTDGRTALLTLFEFFALLSPLAAILGIVSWLGVSFEDVRALIGDGSHRPIALLALFLFTAAAFWLMALRGRRRL
jgi:hypothetical protein